MVRACNFWQVLIFISLCTNRVTKYVVSKRIAFTLFVRGLGIDISQSVIFILLVIIFIFFLFILIFVVVIVYFASVELLIRLEVMFLTSTYADCSYFGSSQMSSGERLHIGQSSQSGDKGKRKAILIDEHIHPAGPPGGTMHGRGARPRVASGRSVGIGATGGASRNAGAGPYGVSSGSGGTMRGRARGVGCDVGGGRARGVGCVVGAGPSHGGGSCVAPGSGPSRGAGHARGVGPSNRGLASHGGPSLPPPRHQAGPSHLAKTPVPAAHPTRGLVDPIVEEVGAK